MKTITAGRFKDRCLKIMDTVAKTRTPVVVMKRGRPVVRVVPYVDEFKEGTSVAGSILKESGNPFRSDSSWTLRSPRRASLWPS
jgi:prevent-host-death family protein